MSFACSPSNNEAGQYGGGVGLITILTLDRPEKGDFGRQRLHLRVDDRRLATYLRGMDRKGEGRRAAWRAAGFSRIRRRAPFERT